MRRLLFIHFLFLWSCGALPVRIDSSVKPSREPDLEAVPEQNFEDFARDQSEALLGLEKADETRSTDAYELYQNGGRDFIRRLLRTVRDANLNEAQSWSMNEKQRTTWEGSDCVSLSLDHIMRTGLPIPRVMTAFPLFGWELTHLTDPRGMNDFHEKTSREAVPLLEDLHRLILFESGIRVRGSRFKKADRDFLEFTYKVVHEKGEPLSWLDRDEWGTRLTFDLERQHPKHQRLLITTEAGRHLYENSAAVIDVRHELLITWDDEGPRSQFHMQLTANHQVQALTLVRDRQEESIALRWQLDENIRQFKLYQSSAGSCHGA